LYAFISRPFAMTRDLFRMLSNYLRSCRRSEDRRLPVNEERDD
jgi:hypothetical protein